MAGAQDGRRPGSRRVGYAIAVLVDVLLLLGIHVYPGWQVVPFLTDDLTEVLPLIDASIVVSGVANLLYLVYDARWFKSLTQVGVNLVGVLASLRLLQVFPFDFSGSTFPWETVTRWVLVIAVVGSAIAVVVEAVRFLAALVRGGRPR